MDNSKVYRGRSTVSQDFDIHYLSIDVGGLRKREWLRFKGRSYFVVISTMLMVAYVAIIAISYIKYETTITPAYSANVQTNLLLPGQLNATIEATKHLSYVDRERLADALYDVSQLFDRAIKLSDDATGEVFQIGNDADATVSISREQLETHRQRLMSILDSAKVFSNDFDSKIDKWKYYSTQIAYIRGDEPNEKPRSLVNTINDYIHYFNAWLWIGDPLAGCGGEQRIDAIAFFRLAAIVTPRKFVKVAIEMFGANKVVDAEHLPLEVRPRALQSVDVAEVADRMKKGKREKPLHLDMSFDEALKRIEQTDLRELPKPKPKAKKAKRQKHKQSVDTPTDRPE
jgi:hypothetical protein